MRKVWNIVGALALIVGGAGLSEAAPLVSLVSSDPLGTLVVGQTATVGVVLSDLLVGEEIEFLAASVGFDAALISPPTITEGAIIPDTTGFLGAGFADLADGSYDTLFAVSGDPIVTTGVFYTFTITAQAVGSGAFAFTFADSIGQDSVGQFLDPVSPGGVLPFVITASQPPTSVPEPSATVLLGTALLGLLGYRWRQRVLR